MLGDIKWSTRQRLSFIEMRAYYCGLISRSDLAASFGISDAAATKDLKLYNDLAAGNLIYKQAAFGFVPTDSFSAYFTDLSPIKALKMMAMNLNSIEGPYGDDSLFKIAASELPIPQRLPDKSILSAITRSIYSKQKLKVSYYSLSGKDIKLQRIIEPHTLVNTGSRWHVRAYNIETFDFRDFVLSRFNAANLLDQPSESSAQYDEDWSEYVPLIIAPHDKLETQKAEILLLDYGAENGQIELQIRRALIGYVLQNLSVDTSKDASGSPHRYPFVLKNRDEIEPFASWVFG